MPSPSWIDQHILRRLPRSASSGTAATNLPPFGGTSTAGTAVAPIPPAGHEAVLETTGTRFVNLPSAGNVYMPAAPLVNRFQLLETFQRRPCINADLASGTEATREPANPDFEILGSNGTSALSTFSTSGGVTLTTAGGANATDQMILVPHLDTAQSAWASTLWKSGKCPSYETTLLTGAAVASQRVWAGFKLTTASSSATHATWVTVDADQAFFVHDTAHATAANQTQWLCVTSRSDVDTTVATGITVQAATHYHLMIQVDVNRIPYFFINGVLVAVGNGTALTGVTTSAGALTDDISLIPQVGVQQLTNSTAAAVTCRGLRCGRNYV